MALHDRIVVDSKILTGKPIVRGTRISVELVVELLAGGCAAFAVLWAGSGAGREDRAPAKTFRKCLIRDWED